MTISLTSANKEPHLELSVASTLKQKSPISPLPVETTGQTTNWSKLGISPPANPHRRHRTPFHPVSPVPQSL
ncbi:hypothetical protein EHO98_12040, partial [Leptospira stimsonii]